MAQNQMAEALPQGTEVLAESLIQVMGPRAAFESCMTSQWFDVAEQIYKISLDGGGESADGNR